MVWLRAMWESTVPKVKLMTIDGNSYIGDWVENADHLAEQLHDAGYATLDVQLVGAGRDPKKSRITFLKGDVISITGFGS
jgi:hypothetical protein